jgi:catechol 2,3-dioxygenase-like lactoylglutathione lyase family enzyme
MECVMDHIVLNVEDIDAMIDFYANVLMLSTDRLDAFREGRVPFPSVRLNGNTVIDLFPKKMWQKGPSGGKDHRTLNHFCLSMGQTAWDSLIERLTANRVVIEEGPVSRWGAHGTGTSVYFRDPERNIIEARFYKGNPDSGCCLLGS